MTKYSILYQPSGKFYVYRVLDQNKVEEVLSDPEYDINYVPKFGIGAPLLFFWYHHLMKLSDLELILQHKPDKYIRSNISAGQPPVFVFETTHARIYYDRDFTCQKLRMILMDGFNFYYRYLNRNLFEHYMHEKDMYLRNKTCDHSNEEEFVCRQKINSNDYMGSTGCRIRNHIKVLDGMIDVVIECMYRQVTFFEMMIGNGILDTDVKIPGFLHDYRRWR